MDPDKGLYAVKTQDGVKVGEVDEEFVYESQKGDRFILFHTALPGKLRRHPAGNAFGGCPWKQIHHADPARIYRGPGRFGVFPKRM